MLFNNKKETIETVGGSATIIGKGVMLTGDIDSTSDIRIDGLVKGNVLCAARVLVGAEGVIEGNIDCKQADVMGKIKGNIKAKELLTLRGKAILNGDIFATKLQVEPTASFNGQCNMNSSTVVEMSKEKHGEPKSIAASKATAAQ